MSDRVTGSVSGSRPAPRSVPVLLISGGVLLLGGMIAGLVVRLLLLTDRPMSTLPDSAYTGSPYRAPADPLAFGVGLWNVLVATTAVGVLLVVVAVVILGMSRSRQRRVDSPA